MITSLRIFLKITFTMALECQHYLLPSVVATKSTEARLRSSIRSGFFKPSYFPITANSIQFKNIESRKTICEPFDIMTWSWPNNDVILTSSEFGVKWISFQKNKRNGRIGTAGYLWYMGNICNIHIIPIPENSNFAEDKVKVDQKNDRIMDQKWPQIWSKMPRKCRIYNLRNKTSLVLILNSLF